MPRQRLVERRDHESRGPRQHVAKCARENRGRLGAGMSGDDHRAGLCVNDPHDRRAPLSQGRQRRLLIGDAVERQSARF